MKTSQLFTIDVENAQLLQEVGNKSAYVNDLITESFKGFTKGATPEQLKKQKEELKEEETKLKERLSYIEKELNEKAELKKAEQEEKVRTYEEEEKRMRAKRTQAQADWVFETYDVDREQAFAIAKKWEGFPKEEKTKFKGQVYYFCEELNLKRKL